jgi:hypothetical protein
MANKYATYADLSAAVDANGSVLAIPMSELRDTHGAGKLGVNVVSNIHDRLEALGLGHVPSDLPREQWAWALLYRKGSAVARLVDAVCVVGEQSDAIVREFAVKDDRASETLKRVKELVCD